MTTIHGAALRHLHLRENAGCVIVIPALVDTCVVPRLVGVDESKLISWKMMQNKIEFGHFKYEFIEAHV